MEEPEIIGIMVNHNTSSYAELALRTLFQSNLRNIPFRMHILDNASDDPGIDDLKVYLSKMNIPLIQTGFDNSIDGVKHNLAIEAFIKQDYNGTHYFIFDSDVWFEEQDIIYTLAEEMEGAGPSVFANQARIYGYYARQVVEGRNGLAGDGGRNLYMWRDQVFGQEYNMSFAHGCAPACCMIRKSAIFHNVVDVIGLGTYWGKRSVGHDAILYNTFSLMTHVMRTHGLEYIVSQKTVMHFMSVAWRPELRPQMDIDCMNMLSRIREMQAD